MDNRVCCSVKGSELHGIWALQATAAAVGSLVTGIAVRLKSRGSR